MTMLAALFALLALPTVEGNNEIANFGPIMCPANEIGHLQDRAARQVSQGWPVVRSLTGPKLFTLDPISQPDVWLTLALVDEEEDLSDVWLQGDTIDSVSDLATEAFPLLSNEFEPEKSPRDRWLETIVPWLKWHLWQKRFSFRVDWPANWPLKVKATVHDAAGMLAAGKVKWQANEHEYETHKRSPDDNFDAPRWPCPRLYVHLHVEANYVPLPPRGDRELPKVRGVKSLIYFVLVYLGEVFLAPLTNEHLADFEIDDPSLPMPVPANLVLEPVFFGFIPHTALDLLAILIPGVLIVYFFVGPEVVDAFNRSMDDEIKRYEEEERRKRQ